MAILLIALLVVLVLGGLGFVIHALVGGPSCPGALAARLLLESGRIRWAPPLVSQVGALTRSCRPEPIASTGGRSHHYLLGCGTEQ
jgi:hypothetical protein